MRIIFLDFDGVIVHTGSPKGIEHPSLFWTDPVCLDRLHRIVVGANASIVISSSWRLLHPWGELIDALGKCGGMVAGMTDDLWQDRVSDSRPGEIKRWLAAHPEVKSYCVLDDVRMKGFGFRMIHLMQGWHNGGLQEKHVEKALRALGKPLSPSGQ